MTDKESKERRSLLIKIIIVIVGVVVLSMIDPFGIMSRTSVKSTASLVSSINQIGELVTAEYYGEVIASLKETKVFDIPRDEAYEKFENCYFDLKFGMVTILQELQAVDNKLNISKKKLIDKISFNELMQDYEENNIYVHLMAFLAGKFSDTDPVKYFKRNGKLRDNTENIVKNYLASQLVALNRSVVKSKNEIVTSDYEDFYNELPDYFDELTAFHTNRNLSQEEKNRKDIVFIGRGWVKAGFDFGTLDESNLVYFSDQKLIRLYGLSATVLDKDINPWFIPEKRIKGFELVNYRNASFEEAKQVKARCKEKLLEQAGKAEILRYAEINGKEALESLFSLLLDEPEIRVEFITMPFETEYQMIKADSLVTVEEALAIDSIYRDYKEQINRSTLAEQEIWKNNFYSFVEKLEQLNFFDEKHYFNLFSLEAAKVLEHRSSVAKEDYNRLLKVRGELDSNLTTAYIRDNIDFKKYVYPVFARDFNLTMDLLNTELTGAERDTTYYFLNLKYPVIEWPIELPEQYENKDSVAKYIDRILASYPFSSGDTVVNSILGIEKDNIRSYSSSQINNEYQAHLFRENIKKLGSTIKKPLKSKTNSNNQP
jgi:hypothetical protein